MPSERFQLSVVALMATATALASAETVMIQAEGYGRSHGRIVRGSDANVDDPRAVGDFIVAADNGGWSDDQQPWFVEYSVPIPHRGEWVLWARCKHPGGADRSYSFDRRTAGPRGRRLPQIDNVNTGGDFWFWTSDSSSPEKPRPRLRMTLPEGQFRFRIYECESTGNARTNGRIDMFLLTDDPDFRPSRWGLYGLPEEKAQPLYRRRVRKRLEALRNEIDALEEKAKRRPVERQLERLLAPVRRKLDTYKEAVTADQKKPAREWIEAQATLADLSHRLDEFIWKARLNALLSEIAG